VVEPLVSPVVGVPVVAVVSADDDDPESELVSAVVVGPEEAVVEVVGSPVLDVPSVPAAEPSSPHAVSRVAARTQGNARVRMHNI
jgi:hypothetical protein